MRSEAEILLAIRSDLRGAAQTIQALKDTRTAALSAGDGVRVFAGAVGAYGLAHAFEQSAKAAIFFNAKLEDTRLGLAGIYRQFKPTEFTDFNKALAASAKTVEQLKKAALETTATFDDLLTAYQAIAGAAFSAGVPMEQHVRLTQLLAQSVTGMGLPAWQIPQEARSILTGNIGADSFLAKSINLTNDQVNQAKSEGRLMQFLEKRLSGMSEAGSRANQTFSGRLSNLGDKVTQMFGEASAPAFEALKGAFAQIGETLSRPEVQQGLNNIGAAAGRVIEITADVAARPGSAEAAMNMVKMASEVYIGSKLFGVAGRIGGHIFSGLQAGGIMLPTANKAGGLLARLFGIGAGEAASISAMEGAAGRFAGGGIGGWLSRQMAMSGAGTMGGLAAHGLGRLGGVASLVGITGYQFGKNVVAPYVGPENIALIQNAIGLLSNEDFERVLTAEREGEGGNAGLDRLVERLKEVRQTGGRGQVAPPAGIFAPNVKELEHRLGMERDQLEFDYRNKLVSLETYLDRRKMMLGREGDIRFQNDPDARRRFIEAGQQDINQLSTESRLKQSQNVFESLRVKGEFNSGRFANAGSLYGFANSTPTLRAMLDELRLIRSELRVGRAALT